MILVGLLAFLVMAGCSTRKHGGAVDKADFRNPQSSVVHTWWHWMDGAITREGITKDLESMHAQGIGQATILNVGLFNYRNLGVPQVDFGSEEWYGMFEWALKEGDRLGIKIGVHNCDGWSTSGGPWITPENSMKQYVWTSTAVPGGQKLDINLPRPLAIQDFYQDQAVVAYRTDTKENDFHLAKPAMTINDTDDANLLGDGCPVSGTSIRIGDYVSIDFDQPYTANRIAVHLRQNFSWDDMSAATSIFTLSGSNDGKNFKRLAGVEIRGLNVTRQEEIGNVSYPYYRLRLDDIQHFGREGRVMISELELLLDGEIPAYAPEIPYHMEKTVSVKPVNLDCIDETDEGANPSVVKRDDVLDLTEHMDAEGRLRWDAPAGNWIILRFGYTTTGVTNGPATPPGRGLECDKMDTSAVDLHFANFAQKLINHAGNYTGNTFKFLLTDSWECMYQNWTGDFASEFEQRRGYSLTRFIPVLCGVTIGDPATSEAFLYDFRKTIAELIESNYYRHFGDLCHRNNLEYHAEVIYGNTNYPPLDILKTNSYIDLPMDEFWAYEWQGDQSLVQYRPSKRAAFNFPASAVVLYDLQVLGAESYTGFAHYSETPERLKPFGNRAFCTGINQMILHSYVHQPIDKHPGFTLGQYASHFNRLNPWWNMADTWLDYHERLQTLLRQGETQFDVLYYLGDQLPQRVENDMLSNLPAGYNALPCNLDVLQNRITVRNGKLVLAGKQEFMLLALPNNGHIGLEALNRISQLVKDGAIVWGEKPTGMFSLKELTGDKDAFAGIVEDLWGTDPTAKEHALGEGKVLWGQDIAAALAAVTAVPDFTTDVQEPDAPLFIHKKADGADVYFVANQQDREIHREFLFRVGNKTPEIWDPQTGEVIEPAVYINENEQTRLPVTLGPYSSRVFVFKSGSASDHIVKVEKGDRLLFPHPAEGTAEALPLAQYGTNGIAWSADVNGTWSVTDAEGETREISLTAPEAVEIRDFDGTISFDPWYPGEVSGIGTGNFRALNTIDRPDIQYFAGMVTYSLRFDLPSAFVGNPEQAWLDLGEIGNTSRVVLNGDTLGTAWDSGARFKVTDLKESDNRMQVTVACNYRNRIIGDYREYGELRNLWTPAPVGMFLNANSELQPSGLTGPVRLVKVKATM